MGIVKRQSIKDTVVQYAGIAIGYLNIGILFPAFLSAAQIGLYSFLNSTAHMLMTITSLGTPATIIRFSPQYKENTGSYRWFLRWIAKRLLIGLLAMNLLLLVTKDWVLDGIYADAPLIHTYYLYLLPLTSLLALFIVISAYVRSHLRIVVPNALEKIGLRLLLALLAWGVATSYFSFSQLIAGFTAAHLLIIIVLLFYAFRLAPLPKKSTVDTNPARYDTRSLSYFGLLNVLTALGSELVRNIDILMLAAMSGLADTGIYNIAFFIGAVIDMPMRSVGQISSPLIAKAWKDHNTQEIDKLYQQSALNLMIAGGVIFVLIYANLDNIFSIIPNGEIYAKGMDVVLLIGAARFISMSMGNNSEIIANSPYYYFNLLSLIGLAVLTFVTNLMLIPQLGITGAALSTAASLTLFNLSKYIFLLVKYKLQPFSKANFLALVIVVVSMLVAYALPKIGSTWVDLFVGSGIITLVYVGLVFLFGLDKDFRDLLPFQKKG